MTKIKEIFESIQGEGKYIGYKQIFIRFCACNLHCKYCDTDFTNDAKEYSPSKLANYINNNFDLKTIHSVSLTGGEPLLFTEFLKEFLPLINKKIYLETNATLYQNLKEIIEMTDIIAADIKLESATGIKGTFELHDNFFNLTKNKDCFAKIVFNQNITNDEIEQCCKLAKKYNLPLILQPEMNDCKMSVPSEFAQQITDTFLKLYPNIRLIPQVHKFMDVR